MMQTLSLGSRRICFSSCEILEGHQKEVRMSAMQGSANVNSAKMQWGLI